MYVRARRVRWTVLFIHPHESPRRHKGDENADTSTLSLYIYTHDSWTGGEREKERERGRYGVGTPGSDPSQLLPIIRVLGFTPTGSTTCSTRLRLCLRARPETLSALSSPRPPFFQTRISNVSATGSKRRLGSISISRYRSVLLAKDVFPRFSFY